MLGAQLFASERLEVLCLGAHCDDVEIGCAATLTQILRRHSGARVRWVVLSSDPVREAETRTAATKLGAGRIDVEVCNFRNGYFPYHGASIKEFFDSLKLRVRPDLVFTHRLEDRHQDHRIVSELTWNTFRDNFILEYEIAKYEGDLGHPNVFVPVLAHEADEKVRVLWESFPSQREKHWFSDETFRSLMRLRGIECNSGSGYAEAFHCRKVVLRLA